MVRTFQIQNLTEMLDSECLKVLHNNMLPEEVAILFILKTKYEREITLNASHSNWTLKKETFSLEFYKRINALPEKVSKRKLCQSAFCFKTVLFSMKSNIHILMLVIIMF